MSDHILLKALDELDLRLGIIDRRIKIVICGAMALEILGFQRPEATHDVDSLLPISDAAILGEIKKVAQMLDLKDHWLNDQASTVDIPNGTVERATPMDRWRNIHASTIARADLIKMKASAFVIRRDETPKDYTDLQMIRPTQDEIDAAIDYVKSIQAPPSGAARKMIEEFKESLDDLAKLV